MSSRTLITRTNLSIDDERTLGSLQSYLDEVQRRTRLEVVVEEEHEPDVVFGDGSRRVVLTWYARLAGFPEDDLRPEAGEDEESHPGQTAGLQHVVAQYAATLEALAACPDLARSVLTGSAGQKHSKAKTTGGPSEPSVPGRPTTKVQKGAEV